MKKRILLGLSFIPALLFAQESYTIIGQVKDASAQAKVYLQYASNNARVLDSAAVVNGAFKFNGTVEHPTKGNLYLAEGGVDLKDVKRADITTVYLSKGVIKVESESGLNKAVLSGNGLNNDLYKYEQGKVGFNERSAAINKEYTEAGEEKTKDKAFVDGLRARMSVVYDESEQADVNFIKENPNSIVTVDLLSNKLSATNVNSLVEPAYSALSSDLKNSKKGKDLAERIAKVKATAIGSIAPDFTLPDTAGTNISLSDLRGKYVLLDFWASWCGPCRQENPNVVAAFNKYKDKNFTVFGVSLDFPGKKDNWLKAIADDQLSQWPQVSDLLGWKSAPAALYEVRGIPQNFLIDPSGKIIGSNLRGEDLEAKLAEILN